MEANVSVSSSTEVSPRIQLETRDDIIYLSPGSLNRTKLVSSISPLAQRESKALCSKNKGHSSPKRKSQTEGKVPRKRYRRRNSAVASMLFPAASNAQISTAEAGFSPPTPGPLQLQHIQCVVRPLEALKKATKILEGYAGHPSPPDCVAKGDATGSDKPDSLSNVS